MQDTQLNIRVSTAQRQEWSARAQEEQLPLASWIKKTLNAAVSQKDARQQAPAIGTTQQEANKGVIPRTKVW